MNITPTPSNITVIMPRNERATALKIKEMMPEAEFTGLSSNSRVDSQGRRWTVNNDPYTKMYSNMTLMLMNGQLAQARITVPPI